MDARVVKRDKQIVVYLAGEVDFESSESFLSVCTQHLLNDEIVFDFEKVVFVGSCGITRFMTAMKKFCGLNSEGVKFCGMGAEFRRIFESNQIGLGQIYEYEVEALRAFQYPDYYDSNQAHLGLDPQKPSDQVSSAITQWTSGLQGSTFTDERGNSPEPFRQEFAVGINGAATAVNAICDVEAIESLSPIGQVSAPPDESMMRQNIATQQMFPTSKEANQLPLNNFSQPRNAVGPRPLEQGPAAPNEPNIIPTKREDPWKGVGANHVPRGTIMESQSMVQSAVAPAIQLSDFDPPQKRGKRKTTESRESEPIWRAAAQSEVPVDQSTYDATSEHQRSPVGATGCKLSMNFNSPSEEAVKQNSVIPPTSDGTSGSDVSS